MDILKKSIILTPSGMDKSIRKNAIITLRNTNNQVVGNLNLDFYKDGKYLLGIMENDKLHKIEIQSKNKEFSLDNFNLNGKISCVLLRYNDLNTPIMWGSTETTKAMKNTINSDAFNFKNEFEDKPVENNNLQKNIKKHDNFNDDNVDNFEEYATHKEFYNDSLNNINNYDIRKNYNQSEIVKDSAYDYETDEEIEKKIDYFLESENINQEESEVEFYNMIKNQVEKMLNENDKEQILEEIIPESVFVSIPKTDGDSYIFGVIKEDLKPKYICYGERTKSYNDKPTHLGEDYQWLPIDVDNPLGEGYFLVYQDAVTGENLKMTII